MSKVFLRFQFTVVKSLYSDTKRGSDISDDISAYDLILKNKERLLSFEEPTRFVFPHSALREGWDNPNVFQICTLKHSDSTTQKSRKWAAACVCVLTKMEIAWIGKLVAAPSMKSTSLP